jgi:XTP/dITP diphosphohydrolase
VSKPRVVLATANPHKADEIAAILGHRFEIVPRPPEVADVDETGDTLLANARLKADAIAAATGAAALADDTGLEVDALGGAPGVRSARFAGEPASDERNVALLLERLAEVTARSARFRTVVYLARPDGSGLWCDGVVEGTIAGERRGATGFGYDPVFIPDDGDGRTFAEMGAEAKHAISHRGRALRALADRLGA